MVGPEEGGASARAAIWRDTHGRLVEPAHALFHHVLVVVAAHRAVGERAARAELRTERRGRHREKMRGAIGIEHVARGEHPPTLHLGAASR